MTVPSCVRCGQLLLPEIVRQLGDGRRCPFCNADLKPDAKVDVIRGAPVRRPPPPAPVARAKASPAAPTLLGVSAARVQPAAAAAVVVAPSTLRSNAASATALARAPEPDTAPNLLSAPPPRPHEAEPVPGKRLDVAPLPSDAAPHWLAARRRRPWLGVAAVLAVVLTIGLVAGRRPTAVPRGSPVPGPTAVPPPAAALPTARPLPPADDQDAPKDPGPAGSPAATGHPKDRARAHVAQRTHHQKRRAAHPSGSKHKRVVALERVAAPKRSEDERSARASYERGNQRLLSGDTAAAISAYEEAVRSAPSHPSGYRGLGLAYEKQGKIAEAVRAFRQYLALAPSSSDRDLVSRRMRHLVRSGGHPGK